MSAIYSEFEHRDLASHLECVIALFRKGMQNQTTAAIEQALAKGRLEGRDMECEVENAERAQQMARILCTYAKYDCSLAPLLLAAADVFRKNKRYDSAAQCYKQALTLQPGHPDAYLRLGAFFREVGNLSGAEMTYRLALKYDPDFFEAGVNLGLLYRQAGRLTEAVTLFRQLGNRFPDQAFVHNNLGQCLLDYGLPEEAGRAFRNAQSLAPSDSRIRSNALLCLCYLRDMDSKRFLKEHISYGQRFTRAVAPWRLKERDSSAPLRIGYVSPDFRAHSVAHFMEPLLAHHDRSHFSVTCYAAVERPDATTKHFMQYECQWRDIAPLSDREAAALINADHIDILVDCAGHTAGGRLPLFGLHPAPIQITYCGYPATTGMSAIAYRFTDSIADPGNRAGAETLWRLDPCFLCYRPPRNAPGISPPPCRERGYVTFGSFNNIAKVNSEVVALWSRILSAAPGSRLLLKARALDDQGLRERFGARFAVHGIDAGRIDYIGYSASTEGHLEKYSSIDIALDTFPYNGATTTCEALWMGVPVVCLCGRNHRGRVGASLLHAIAYDFCIANDKNAYVAVAAALAADPERLAQLRCSQRERMEACPLREESSFVSKIEDAYRTIWSRLMAEKGKAA